MYTNNWKFSIAGKAMLIVGSMLFFGVIKWFSRTDIKTDVLIVGTCSGFPPYEMISEQGDLVGFDIDIAHMLAHQMGKKLELKDMSFDALILGLQQGNIDCAIAGISITKDRQQEIALIHYVGEPLTKLPLLFWNEIPAGIKGIEDVCRYTNKTVCAQAGTLQQEVISSYPGLDVKFLENIPDLIIDIKYGKSIAAVIEPKVAYALQGQHPELKVLDIPLTTEQQDFGSGIGIKKENRELIDKVGAIISMLKSDGSIAKLEAKWFTGGAYHDPL
jgi:polar amino acid transport system substrate-binding protein